MPAGPARLAEALRRRQSCRRSRPKGPRQEYDSVARSISPAKPANWLDPDGATEPILSLGRHAGCSSRCGGPLPHRLHFVLLRPLVRTVPANLSLCGICGPGSDRNVRGREGGARTGAGHALPGRERTDPAPSHSWHEELENITITATESAEFARNEEERERRIASTRIMSLASECGWLAHHWLADRAESLLAASDDVLRESIAIVAHDALLLGRSCIAPSMVGIGTATTAKATTRFRMIGTGPQRLRSSHWSARRRRGRSSQTRPAARYRRGSLNASANLSRDVETEFPEAHLFVRPGFDEPEA